MDVLTCARTEQVSASTPGSPNSVAQAGSSPGNAKAPLLSMLPLPRCGGCSLPAGLERPQPAGGLSDSCSPLSERTGCDDT